MYTKLYIEQLKIELDEYEYNCLEFNPPQYDFNK